MSEDLEESWQDGFPHKYGRFIGMDLARRLPGGRGEGVRVVSVDFEVDQEHEDLQQNFRIIRNADTGDHYKRYHGSSVVGIIGADDNGQGAEGLAPEAQSLFYSLDKMQPKDVALDVLAHTRPGDIVNFGIGTGVGGPIEFDGLWNEAMRDLVNDGRTCICGAGNHNVNYDTEFYPEYLPADSGSIVVAACTCWDSPRPINSTSYGTRVDCSAPGFRVMTTRPNDEYGYFLQTSCAQAVCAGFCAVLQAIHLAEFGQVLQPAEMREILRTTGVPLDFSHLPEKEGKAGKMMHMRSALKKVLRVPDYDGDDSVGFRDFLSFARRYPSNAEPSLTFAQFRRHYRKSWPDDYPLHRTVGV